LDSREAYLDLTEYGFVPGTSLYLELKSVLDELLTDKDPARARQGVAGALLRILELSLGRGRSDGIAWGLEALREETQTSIKKWLLWAATNMGDRVESSQVRFYSRAGKGTLTVHPTDHFPDRCDWERKRMITESFYAKMVARLELSLPDEISAVEKDEAVSYIICSNNGKAIFEQALTLLETSIKKGDLLDWSESMLSVVRDPCDCVTLVGNMMLSKPFTLGMMPISLDEMKTYVIRHLEQVEMAHQFITRPVRTNIGAMGGLKCLKCGYDFCSTKDEHFGRTDEQSSFALYCPRCAER
jgi:hypothetical protein